MMTFISSGAPVIYVKVPIIIALSLCAVAVVLYSITLPAIFAPPCMEYASNGKICTIPSPSYEIELGAAIFAGAIAIAGIGLLVTYRLEKPNVKQNA
jgi:hypothetical protein